MSHLEFVDIHCHGAIMILFSAIPYCSIDAMYGDAWTRKRLSILELYSSHKSIRSNSATALFLLSLTLSNFTPYHQLNDSIGCILSNIDTMKGDNFPYVCRIALATLDDLLSKYGEINTKECNGDYPFQFHHIMKLWTRLSIHKGDRFLYRCGINLERLIISTLTGNKTSTSFTLITAIRESCQTETIKAAIDGEKYELLKAFLKYDAIYFAYVVAPLVVDSNGNIMFKGLLAATMVCELETRQRGRVDLLAIENFRNIVGIITPAICHLFKDHDVSLLTCT